VSWLIDGAMRRYRLQGTWLGAPATLDVELALGGTPELSSGPQTTSSGNPTGSLCEDLRVPVQVSLSVVREGAGAMLVAERGSSLRLGFGQGTVRLGLLPEDVLTPESFTVLELPTSPFNFGTANLELVFATEPLAAHDLVLSRALIQSVEGNTEFLRPVPLPPPLPDACSRAEPTEPVSFLDADPDADAAAAAQRAVGRWALCDANPLAGADTRPRGIVGVEIRTDRSWQAILPGSEPEFGSGFEREGVITMGRGENERLIYLAELGYPGIWNDEHRWQLQLGALDSSVSGNTLFAGMLVRLDVPVAPAVPPPFVRGERAGLAGCTGPETELEGFANPEAELEAVANPAELLSALEGRWVGCSRFSGEVRFDSDGGVEVMPSESYVGHTGLFGGRVIGSAAQFGLVGPGMTSWILVRSLRPLKLWMYPAYRVYMDHADPLGPEPMVFSAVP
jgi:hypothetical protein